MRRAWDTILGVSGITVSRLSFGTVFMGHQGDGLSPAEGAALLLYAHRQGVYFWDTSDDYGTHAHVAEALREIPRDEVVISSKLYDTRGPVEALLDEIGTDYLDILLLHDVENAAVDGAAPILSEWRRHRDSGAVRALGLSTHSAPVAEQVAEWPDVDVLMLPINSTGYCTRDCSVEGGVERMMAAAERASRTGKGIVAMKVMGCGTLVDNPAEAVGFVADLSYIDSMCIGMRTKGEITRNAHMLKRCSG